MAAPLTVLRRYALAKPESLPSSILFSHNKDFLTIFDGYPKALFHFLILPRAVSPLTPFNLSSLRTLLSWDKTKAKALLLKLQASAKELCAEIEKEMMARYLMKWPIHCGFHAVPSMEHLHLHVISSDFVSPSMKNKKHYNSFHPRLGFFLHLDDILEWFDSTDDYWKSTIRLPKESYEPLLKDDLQCWKCQADLKNMPTLKSHLQEHFDVSCKKARDKSERLQRKKEAEADPTTVQKAVDDTAVA